MNIVTIALAGAGVIRVTLAAANELVFDVACRPEHDYDQTIADICRIAPTLMRYDAELAEAFDDGGRTQPNGLALKRIRMFTTAYRDRLSNCQVDFGGFPQDGAEEARR